MITWITYYYNILILTDARVVEINQNGLFNRDVNELVFEQVEDVSCHTKGVLNSLFDAGDIELQTAGSQRNFTIKSIPLPSDTVSIINDLTLQAKRGVSHRERIPDLPVIGIINGRHIPKSGNKPPIMNLDMNLKDNIAHYKQKYSKPKTMREKIDYWWWRHSQQMAISFGPEDDNAKEDLTIVEDSNITNNINEPPNRLLSSVKKTKQTKESEDQEILSPIDEIK